MQTRSRAGKAAKPAIPKQPKKSRKSKPKKASYAISIEPRVTRSRGTVPVPEEVLCLLTSEDSTPATPAATPGRPKVRLLRPRLDRAADVASTSHSCRGRVLPSHSRSCKERKSLRLRSLIPSMQPRSRRRKRSQARRSSKKFTR